MAKDVVVIGVYPETRRRINVHAAAKGMKQPDYVDSMIPDVPGEPNAKKE
jgi:hypothetical protein